MLYEVRVEDIEGAWFKHFGAAQKYTKLCNDAGLNAVFQLVKKHVEED